MHQSPKKSFKSMENYKLKIRRRHLAWKTPNKISNKSFCSVGNGYIFNEDSRIRLSQKQILFNNFTSFSQNLDEFLYF
jgi:hypothetical protein